MTYRKILLAGHWLHCFRGTCTSRASWEGIERPCPESLPGLIIRRSCCRQRVPWIFGIFRLLHNPSGNSTPLSNSPTWYRGSWMNFEQILYRCSQCRNEPRSESRLCPFFQKTPDGQKHHGKWIQFLQVRKKSIAYKVYATSVCFSFCSLCSLSNGGPDNDTRK